MEEKEPNQSHVTMHDNLINYLEGIGANTARLFLIKILSNSVISTQVAWFTSTNLTTFYLMTPLKQLEFIKLLVSDILEEIILK